MRTRKFLEKFRTAVSLVGFEHPMYVREGEDGQLHKVTEVSVRGGFADPGIIIEFKRKAANADRQETPHEG